MTCQLDTPFGIADLYTPQACTDSARRIPADVIETEGFMSLQELYTRVSETLAIVHVDETAVASLTCPVDAYQSRVEQFQNAMSGIVP